MAQRYKNIPPFTLHLSLAPYAKPSYSLVAQYLYTYTPRVLPPVLFAFPVHHRHLRVTFLFLLDLAHILCVVSYHKYSNPASHIYLERRPSTWDSPAASITIYLITFLRIQRCTWNLRLGTYPHIYNTEIHNSEHYRTRAHALSVCIQQQRRAYNVYIYLSRQTPARRCTRGRVAAVNGDCVSGQALCARRRRWWWWGRASRGARRHGSLSFSLSLSLSTPPIDRVRSSCDVHVYTVVVCTHARRASAGVSCFLADILALFLIAFSRCCCCCCCYCRAGDLARPECGHFWDEGSMLSISLSRLMRRRMRGGLSEIFFWKDGGGMCGWCCVVRRGLSIFLFSEGCSSGWSVGTAGCGVGICGARMLPMSVK